MEVVVSNDWGDERVFDSRKDVDAFFMKEAEALMDRCRRRRRGMAREVVESCKDSIERSLARVKKLLQGENSAGHKALRGKRPYFSHSHC